MMRNLNEISGYRIPDDVARDEFGNSGDHGNGAFLVPYPRFNAKLQVIASNGDGWDHISVSLSNRTPRWEEMDFVKRMFFKPDELAFQLHVPASEHINCHPYCLHIWRPHGPNLPMPPKEMV